MNSNAAPIIDHDHAPQSGVGGEPLRHPCSLAQERFWFLDRLDPGNPSLNVAVRWRLVGAVTTAEIEHAFRIILARHEVLRTHFDEIDGEPSQLVSPSIPFHVPSVDLTGLDAEEAHDRAEQIAAVEARTAFNLKIAPLIRVIHLRLPGDVSIALVTAHHIVSDGWSIGLLAHEMGEICAAAQAGRPPHLAELPISYGEFATWQKQWLDDETLEADSRYWRQNLAGMRQTELTTDFPRPPMQTANGQILSVLLERPLTNGLTELGRRQGCTLFMTALSALLALLHRYSGESDIAIGTQVTGRDEIEIENLVGLFINTLILRADLSGDPTFIEVMARARKTVLDGFEHQQLPLQKLIEIVKPKRDLSRNPLFSVNFIFQRSFIKGARYGSFELADMPSRTAGAMYDLNLFMVERPDGWRLSCEYNSDLFAEATIGRMIGHVINLMRAALVDPDRSISRLPILAAEERQALVAHWSPPEKEYPRDRALPQLFAAQAARTPDETAVICGERVFTYRQLDRESDRLARALMRLEIVRGSHVGVFLSRSPDMVVALLAVLKSGNAYIPLDPGHPADRLAYIVENSGMAAVVTETALAAAPAIAGTRKLLVDRPEMSADEATLPKILPEDIAYVIYTSGSTGRPKGVRVHHQALVNLLWAMRDRPGLTAADTLLAVTTIAFDIAGLEIFLPLVTGARVVVAKEDETIDGPALRDLLRRHNVTVLQATPATWRLLIETGWQGDPPLRMLCGGEALPRDLADQLLERGGELWNLYGPTETTIWSSALKVEAGKGAVPIGPPIANTQFYLLDQRLEPVPQGVPGELVIGGDGVAPGYLDLPELTGERFVPDPFRDIPGARLYRTGDLARLRHDGSLEFLGRFDHQIKLRGFRIELGEIESVLARHPAVKECVAVAGAGPSAEPVILAYVAGQQSPQLEGELRTLLRESLPAYMIPSSITILDALPRAPTGKIDRNNLPAPRWGKIAEIAPLANQTRTEARIAAIWSTLLGVEITDKDADFFDLGGHSLLAARMLAAIEVQFGRRIGMAALFKAPTIGALAALLDHQEQNAYDFREVVKLQANGARPAVIALNNTGVYYTLSQKLGPDQPFTILQLFDPALRRDQMPGSIEEIAAGYVDLIRTTQPNPPYVLLGWCVGGVIAFEVARQLRAAGQEVALVAIVDSWVPGYLRRLPRFKRLIADYLYRAQLVKMQLWDLFAHKITLRDFLMRRRLFRRFLGDPRTPIDSMIEAKQRAGAAYDRWLTDYFREATDRYDPQPYDGRVLVLRGDLEPTGLFLDQALGWTAFSRPDMKATTISGNHYSIFQSPGVDEMADQLAKAIDVARKDSANTDPGSAPGRAR